MKLTFAFGTVALFSIASLMTIEALPMPAGGSSGAAADNKNGGTKKQKQPEPPYGDGHCSSGFVYTPFATENKECCSWEARIQIRSQCREKGMKALFSATTSTKASGACPTYDCYPKSCKSATSLLCPLGATRRASKLDKNGCPVYSCSFGKSGDLRVAMTRPDRPNTSSNSNSTATAEPAPEESPLSVDEILNTLNQSAEKEQSAQNSTEAVKIPANNSEEKSTESKKGNGTEKKQTGNAKPNGDAEKKKEAEKAKEEEAKKKAAAKANEAKKKAAAKAQQAEKKAAEKAKADAERKAAEKAKADAERKAAEKAKADAERKAAEMAKAQQAKNKAAAKAKAQQAKKNGGKGTGRPRRRNQNNAGAQRS